MLRTLRRFPALAAILALSLIAGPAASALCAHVGEHVERGTHGERPPETPAEAPCHEGTMPAEAPGSEDTSGSDHSGADCDAPCCVAAVEAVATVPSLSPPSAPAPAVVDEIVRTPAPSVPVQEAVGRPPPSRLYQETGRIRI